MGLNGGRRRYDGAQRAPQLCLRAYFNGKPESELKHTIEYDININILSGQPGMVVKFLAGTRC